GVSWGAFPIDDVPPGVYDVFAETLRKNDMESVGGRTTNVVFAPDDASIIVNLVDSLCCPIYNSGATVTATPAQQYFLKGRAQYQGVMMQSTDKWKLSNLP